MFSVSPVKSVPGANLISWNVLEEVISYKQSGIEVAGSYALETNKSCSTNVRNNR